MSTNFIYAEPPNSVTHSALDFFKSSQILIDFQRSYQEHVHPHTSFRALNTNAHVPVLEFEFQGPKTEIGRTVVDMKNLFVQLELKLVDKSGAVKKVQLRRKINNLSLSKTWVKIYFIM